MADIEALKRSRAAAKRNVTIITKRLSAAFQVGLEVSPEDIKNLDSAFSEFFGLHLDYCEQADVDDDDYLNEVHKVYTETLTLYKNAMTSKQSVQEQRGSAPLRNNFCRSQNRLALVLDRVENTLLGAETADVNISSLRTDRDEIEQLVSTSIDDLTKLTGVIATVNEEETLNNTIKRADDLKRRVNILIHKSQNVLSLSSGPPSPGFSIPVSTGASSTESLPTQVISQSLQQTGSQTVTQAPVSQSSVSAVATGLSNYISTSTDPNSSVGVAPMSSATGFNMPPVSAAAMPSTAGTGFVQGSSTGYAPPAHAYNLPPTGYAVGSPYGGTAVPGTTPRYSTFHNTTPGYGVFTPSQVSQASSSTIQTKKPSLPTFTGNRADWPEFKCVWRSLAESQFSNRMQLAMELKKACIKGKASDAVRHVYVTSDTAYEEIWQRLSEEFDDPGLSVQCAISTLMGLKSVGDRDYRGIVQLVNTVEGVHNQLKELGQLEAIHMADVDRISMLLPKSMSMDWNRRYRDLGVSARIRPFPHFVAFLRAERSAVARLVDSTGRVKDEHQHKRHAVSSHATESDNPSKFCALHGETGHKTADCRQFKKLSVKEKYDALRKDHLCFRCFGRHQRGSCKAPSCKCGKSHHKLLCASSGQQLEADTHQAVAAEKCTEAESDSQASLGTHLASDGAVALYPIHQAHVAGSSKPITVFADGGSNASYVTESCASRLRLKKVSKVTVDVTTVGGEQKMLRSAIYEVPVRTQTGKIERILAYGLKTITGPISQIQPTALHNLFPDHDVRVLTRPSTVVDLMIGTDYFGLHPKHEVAKAGNNLSIMQGELGLCLVGTHPLLKEKTVMSREVPGYLNGSYSRANTHLTTSHGTHRAFAEPHAFIIGEELSTESVPKCGGCKCGKCPQPGHDLSFREEQELHMIRSSLQYDLDGKRWITSYPWLVDPESLPDNRASALATLRSTERSLKKDPKWATSYSEQMQDMVDRQAARKLSKLEMEQWQGAVFYVSHLAVANPKSNSTPVRIVFNSSQTFRGVSLNSCLAKGPDSYLNSSLSILLRWREERVAIVGDIRKMFHSVFLAPLEQHCHRFLWRELNSERDPDVYIMQRVNMGDRPAAAIATEALYMTADMGQDRFPRAAQFIKGSSYMDDLIDSVESKHVATELALETETLLHDGGFQVKCWQLTGDTAPTSTSGQQQLKGDAAHTGVLGVTWHPVKDTMTYQVVLNFSEKRRGARVGPDLRCEDIPEAIPLNLTRRHVLQQVMSIYDPMGLASPFTLLAKIYLRETWALKLDWDEPLPEKLRAKWVLFFRSLFDLEKLDFPRCLRPDNAEGLPWLIILSDGSELAYGCAAYVRWKLSDGTYKLRLIMAKSRIAPLDKVSIPRMELNGAVLSKRCRNAITKEMRYNFERVLHLVDSETVLNMLNKTSYRFKVYEGVRLGEIQAATGGDMTEWAWIPGVQNTADWLTRGRLPGELDEKSEWFSGPPMLSLPFDQWTVKFGRESDDILPGEKCITKTHAVNARPEPHSLVNYDNISTMSKARRVVARLLGIARKRSFKGGHSVYITVEQIQLAEEFLLREAQMDTEVNGPNYRRLNPAKRENGIWVVGASRLARHNPLGAIHAELPIFIPKGHPLARLTMRDAHTRGHRGRDATLAAFRNKYWTPRAPALAKSVRNACQLCKLRDTQPMTQEMGALPLERLRPSPPFSHCMVDLFGPYSVRGEVQKRTSGKAWGVIFTDMASRAVHIEGIFGYDTSSFLLALTRFVSIRGWPSKIYSDPGSQLLGASNEIKEAAARVGADNGMEWVFGPADSPWHQGAVESLVKSAKRALNLAVHNQRLSAPEFLTVCSEAANVINERPLGLLPDLESDINVLTPNCLLLGRATASNPNGWQPGNPSVKTRYHLVNAVADQFWKHWVELFAHSLVYRPKWHQQQRDLQPGDVVLVADHNALRGEYRLAKVSETYPGRDGHVRSARVIYKRFRVKEAAHEYKGAPYAAVVRSVQKLVLLVPVDTNPSDKENTGGPEREE